MKKITVGFILIMFFAIACGTGPDRSGAIVGKWQGVKLIPDNSMSKDRKEHIINTSRKIAQNLSYSFRKNGSYQKVLNSVENGQYVIRKDSLVLQPDGKANAEYRFFIRELNDKSLIFDVENLDGTYITFCFEKK